MRGGVPDAKVRVVRTNGIVWYYEGDKGDERRVRAESADGRVLYFR
eukprot:COSAG01_NODE_18209_length_1092_cov_6.192346_2_plen_46_part_00